MCQSQRVLHDLSRKVTVLGVNLHSPALLPRQFSQDKGGRASAATEYDRTGLPNAGKFTEGFRRILVQGMYG